MVPKHAANLPWRSIGDRCVVIQPARGEVHELDEVGTFLWRAADGNTPLEEIAARLTESFEVDVETAVSDTAEFFGKLESLGLLACPS